MKYVLFLLLIGGTLLSCKSKKKVLSLTSSTESDVSSKRDTVPIEIKALDLTEDMSRLSSNNDEVLLLIYELKTDNHLGESLCSNKKVLSISDNILHSGFSTDHIAIGSSVLFLILEQDSETAVEQVDAIFRIHYAQILRAFDSRNYLEIEKYLGDEDLIGYKVIKEINHSVMLSFEFRGVYKLDSYHYRIRIGY